MVRGGARVAAEAGAGAGVGVAGGGARCPAVSAATAPPPPPRAAGLRCAVTAAGPSAAAGMCDCVVMFNVYCIS